MGETYPQKPPLPPPISWPTVRSLALSIGHSWPRPVSRGSPAFQRTWHAAQGALAQADPQTLAPRTAGSRSHVVPARSGGGAPRWGRLSAAPRQPPAQRPVDTPWRQPRDRAVTAFQPLGRPACAGAAAAPQALAPCAHAWPATLRHDSPICPPPQSPKRGRPGPGAQPDQSVSQSVGALASRRAARQARVDQHRGVILATPARDAVQVPALEIRAGYTGQAEAARGCRVLKAPQFVAAARSRKKPARLMALWMVMTVGGLVSAA
jgi:hypothetical protein